MALASNALFHLGIGQHTAESTTYLNWMFGEGQARIIVATSKLDQIQEQAVQLGVKTTEIGGAKRIPDVNMPDEASVYTGNFNLPLSKLREAHEGWLPNYMSKVD